MAHPQNLCEHVFNLCGLFSHGSTPLPGEEVFIQFSSKSGASRSWESFQFKHRGLSHFFQLSSLLPKILGSAELAVQSQQSHSMMAQAMKYPNVSETKHILIILIVLYNSQGKIGKIDRYMYKNMIYDIWYMIYWWQKFWPKLSQRSNPERPWLELGIW